MHIMKIKAGAITRFFFVKKLLLLFLN